MFKPPSSTPNQQWHAKPTARATSSTAASSGASPTASIPKEHGQDAAKASSLQRALPLFKMPPPPPHPSKLFVQPQQQQEQPQTPRQPPSPAPTPTPQHRQQQQQAVTSAMPSPFQQTSSAKMALAAGRANKSAKQSSAFLGARFTDSPGEDPMDSAGELIREILAREDERLYLSKALQDLDEKSAQAERDYKSRVEMLQGQLQDLSCKLQDALGRQQSLKSLLETSENAVQACKQEAAQSNKVHEEKEQALFQDIHMLQESYLKMCGQWDSFLAEKTKLRDALSLLKEEMHTGREESLAAKDAYLHELERVRSQQEVVLNKLGEFTEMVAPLAGKLQNMELILQQHSKDYKTTVDEAKEDIFAKLNLTNTELTSVVQMAAKEYQVNIGQLLTREAFEATCKEYARSHDWAERLEEILKACQVYDSTLLTDALKNIASQVQMEMESHRQQHAEVMQAWVQQWETRWQEQAHFQTKSMEMFVDLDKRLGEMNEMTIRQQNQEPHDVSTVSAQTDAIQETNSDGKWKEILQMKEAEIDRLEQELMTVKRQQQKSHFNSAEQGSERTAMEKKSASRFTRLKSMDDNEDVPANIVQKELSVSKGEAPTAVYQRSKRKSVAGGFVSKTKKPNIMP